MGPNKLYRSDAMVRTKFEWLIVLERADTKGQFARRVAPDPLAQVTWRQCQPRYLDRQVEYFARHPLVDNHIGTMRQARTAESRRQYDRTEKHCRNPRCLRQRLQP